MASAPKRPDKETILGEIRRLAAEDGRAPGTQSFARRTGIRERQWSGRYWATWGDAVREAGLEPSEWASAIPNDDLLASLARLARSLGRFPKDREIELARVHDRAFPAAAVFRRLGTKAEKIAALRAWVNTNDDFTDLIAILARESDAPSNPQSPLRHVSTASPVDLSESWVPPVIACLPHLAIGEGTNAALEFERRVAIALRLLGLQVRELGQGHGRTADCLAICRERHWAMICDAKSRVGGFAFNATEERKFREYIERHERELRPEGIEKVYLLVVSSDFDMRDVGKAKELKRTTGAHAVALLSADVLVDLVEEKLKGDLSLDDLERSLADTGIVAR